MKNNGISFGGVLQLVFITLKLCGVIHWSWWWVLSPTWIAFSLIVLFVAFYMILIFVRK